ncbi:MAG: hypothetical protein MJB14_13140 [Spirochaetes bacterium]|nr:hypothetical protein [Spirochaetota bacterium]
MKKYLLICLIILVLLPLFSQVKQSNFTLLKQNQNNPFQLAKISSLQLLNEESKIEKAVKVDQALKIAHATLAGISYACFWAVDAIGIALIYNLFKNPDGPYYQGLVYAHLGVAIPTFVIFGSALTIAFTKLGMKFKNGLPIRKPHMAAAFVSSAAYLLEIASVVLSAVFFINDFNNKEWVGLAHGITCGVSTLSISVSLITIFF